MSVFAVGAAVTAGTAVVSTYQAHKEGKRADRAQRAAIAQADRVLEFEMEQYDRWVEIYGDIEENLGEFYDNLTPDRFIAAGLEESQQKFQAQREQTMATLDQRNLTRSGITAALESQSKIAQAEHEAGIRRDAEFKVAEAKQSFVKPADTSGVVNAMNNKGAMYEAQAERHRANSASMYQSAGQMLGAGLKFAGRYGGKPDMTANQGGTKPAVMPTGNTGSFPIDSGSILT